MIEWINTPAERQREILGLVSRQTGLPAYAIEKDWWVTLALFAIFRTAWTEHLVFKGGTSLSKSWNLIERFSEDIDLVIDRAALGFAGDLSNQRIKKLRKVSFSFTSGEFRKAIENELLRMGIPSEIFSLTAKASTDSDRDPQILELSYNSVLEKGTYLKDTVLIEVGARSLKEPSETTEISSIISNSLGEKTIAGKSFNILTVRPERTFLEKIFLLHEEFSKPEDKIRNDRMSRHLYDIEKIMDTTYGTNALANRDLYSTIVEHRSKYNAMKGIDYSLHSPSTVSFIPGDNVIKSWEEDYKAMQENMIYGESIPFAKLLSRMKILEHRLRLLS